MDLEGSQEDPPNHSEVDFRPGPLPFCRFFRFFVFTFGHQLGSRRSPGFRREAFRFPFFVFIRFYSFLPFDAIWLARQGRLPGTLEPGAFFVKFVTQKIRGTDPPQGGG